MIKAECPPLINQEFLVELVNTHGIIPAIKMVDKMHQHKLNKKLDDGDLGLIVWQIGHSIDQLEEASGIPINSIADVEVFSEMLYSAYTNITAKHLILAIDALIEYLDLDET